MKMETQLRGHAQGAELQTSVFRIVSIYQVTSYLKELEWKEQAKARARRRKEMTKTQRKRNGARKARGESMKQEAGFFEKVGNAGKPLVRVMEIKEGRRSNRGGKGEQT